MGGPLEGVRVVDLGFWVAAPAVAGILADWGADVVKVEPPDGDPLRGLFLSFAGMDVPFNPPFELDNRGKRSLALNLREPEGREIAHKLVRGADVLVTNLRAPALAGMGLDWASVRELNPKLVYCAISGYGSSGPERDRAAYDVGAFWARTGIASSLVPEGGEPPQQRPGFGDHATALGAVAAVAAALFARERSGRGQLVSTSLLRTGLYAMGWDVNIRLRFGKLVAPHNRFGVQNPLINCYRSGDERWFWILGLQADRHWPDLLRAVERPDLLQDPRFSDIRSRRHNRRACVETLDGIFHARPMAHWAERFDREGVWWAPVQSVAEAIADPQAQASSCFIDAPVADGSTRMVATPADFSGDVPVPVRMPPELGQHSEEILLELGYDWNDIAGLRERGVIS